MAPWGTLWVKNEKNGRIEKFLVSMRYRGQFALIWIGFWLFSHRTPPSLLLEERGVLRNEVEGNSFFHNYLIWPVCALIGKMYCKIWVTCLCLLFVCHALCNMIILPECDNTQYQHIVYSTMFYSPVAAGNLPLTFLNQHLRSGFPGA